MSYRARRLAKYLEGELGWTVYQYHTECPKCQVKRYSESARYCEVCGTKLSRFKADHKDIESDIEGAIKSALQEDQ